jgi:hypothetical protein
MISSHRFRLGRCRRARLFPHSDCWRIAKRLLLRPLIRPTQRPAVSDKRTQRPQNGVSGIAPPMHTRARDAPRNPRSPRQAPTRSLPNPWQDDDARLLLRNELRTRGLTGISLLPRTIGSSLGGANAGRRETTRYRRPAALRRRRRPSCAALPGLRQRVRRGVCRDRRSQLTRWCYLGRQSAAGCKRFVRRRKERRPELRERRPRGRREAVGFIPKHASRGARPGARGLSQGHKGGVRPRARPTSAT